jgi:acetyl esterase/lipase
LAGRLVDEDCVSEDAALRRPEVERLEVGWAIELAVSASDVIGLDGRRLLGTVIPAQDRPTGGVCVGRAGMEACRRLQSLALRVFSNEEYARPDGIPLCFDLYHPGDGAQPLIVFVHGGGWISGERDMYSEEAEWFAGLGFATATIDYRLAPLYPFPSALVDVQAFVRFIRSKAQNYGVDPGQIAAMGNSAGGHLAAMLGVSRVGFGGEGAVRVDAVVDVCGLTDMRNPSDTQYPISMSFIEQFLGGGYLGREEDYALASPVTHVSEKCCPFLIVHGSMDDVVPPAQSQALHDALRAQGGVAELIVLEGEGHSFTLEAWDNVRSEAARFLKGVFGGS